MGGQLLLVAMHRPPAKHRSLLLLLQGKGIIGLAWKPVPCEAINGTASLQDWQALQQATGGLRMGSAGIRSSAPRQPPAGMQWMERAATSSMAA